MTDSQKTKRDPAELYNKFDDEAEQLELE